MPRHGAALLVVALLATLALAAGAANLDAVGDLQGPAPDGEPAQVSTPPEPPTDDSAEQSASSPPRSDGCEGCPSTGWPSLIDVVDGLPGGALLAAVGVVVLAALLSWSVLRRPAGVGVPGGSDTSDRSATVPKRAGDGVPTVASPPASSEVDRAWRDLRRTVADRIARDAASLTPGEVATAARHQGVDPELVSDLTRLFEAVRYGGRPATDERERRAAAARARLDGEASAGESASTGEQSSGGERS